MDNMRLERYKFRLWNHETQVQALQSLATNHTSSSKRTQL